MDELDAAILREMLRGRVLLWGSADPRVRTSALAARLGVDRTTVWSRLKAWRAEGFLRRQEVVPNPCLFGAGIAAGDIRVDDPRCKAQVLETLALVDGVLAGADQVGPYVLLLYAHESPAALDRCTRLVRQLPGVDDVSLCSPFEPPRSRIELLPSDWRILEGLRELPDRPLREVAERAQISTRTFSRRYAELLDANAIWAFPSFDFTCYRGAVFARFLVTTTTLDGRRSLVNACRRGLPQTVWWDAPPAPATAQGGSAEEACWVDVYCHLGSAADVEAVHAWFLDRPSVDAVEVFFPRSWFMLQRWFDERIAKHVPEPVGVRREPHRKSAGRG